MNMDAKLKEIFHQIQAEEELKSATKMFLERKTQGYTKIRTEKRQYMVYAAACACLLIMLFGGRWLYFTPTAEISIDINPSIELSINRFDQVISVNSFNKDGQELLKVLNIKFKNYEDAMEQILENDKIITLLSNDEIMTITVTGPDGLQSSKILSEVESCTAQQRNTYCYFASEEKVAEAHALGLSYGKYRAFLEVQLLDPDITPETIQGMTMREIRELINRLAAECGDDASIYESPENGNYDNGQDNEQGNGHEQGNGQHQQGNEQHQQGNGQHGQDNGQHQQGNGQHQQDNGQHQQGNGQHAQDNGQHQQGNGQREQNNGQHQQDNGQHQQGNGQHQQGNGQHGQDNGQHGQGRGQKK